jgi:ribokinase
VSRVFVVGSIKLDVVATADRHPPSGETVTGGELHLFPGGKGANQAVAAHRADRPAASSGAPSHETLGKTPRVPGLHAVGDLETICLMPTRTARIKPLTVTA